LRISPIPGVVLPDGSELWLSIIMQILSSSHHVTAESRKLNKSGLIVYEGLPDVISCKFTGSLITSHPRLFMFLISCFVNLVNWICPALLTWNHSVRFTPRLKGVCEFRTGAKDKHTNMMNHFRFIMTFFISDFGLMIIIISTEAKVARFFVSKNQ
jgi:hypothetical protein